MKKMLVIILSLVMVIILAAGCGSVSATESPRMKESSSAAVTSSEPAATPSPGKSAEPTPSPTPEAKILDMGEPFKLEGGTLVVTGVDDSPAFSPADMKETERAVSVATLMEKALADNEEITGGVTLKNTDGTVYKSGVTLTMDKGDKTQVTFLFAIPKETKLSDLAFWLNGEGRKLSQ